MYGHSSSFLNLEWMWSRLNLVKSLYCSTSFSYRILSYFRVSSASCSSSADCIIALTCDSVNMMGSSLLGDGMAAASLGSIGTCAGPAISWRCILLMAPIPSPSAIIGASAAPPSASPADPAAPTAAPGVPRPRPPKSRRRRLNGARNLSKSAPAAGAAAAAATSALKAKGDLASTLSLLLWYRGPLVFGLTGVRGRQRFG
mmetsp:Transcript_9948/g.25511  ORF Transcript_9948/g.25511 Transcript_9948/m.25511 type:complete len:201 (-) Transcript_9948:137-739(-)